MKKTVLFINAGHGNMTDKGENLTTNGKFTNHTNGNPYHYNGTFFEGVFNRNFATEFIIEATKLGFLCIPVFEPYKDIHQKRRALLANEIAKDLQCQSIYLSFHANAATNTTEPQHYAGGVCALVYKKGTEIAQHAERMTKGLQDIFDKHGSKRRGSLIYDTPLDETYFTAMPAILFELGFFDNPQNASLIISKDFRAKLIGELTNYLKCNFE